ncbi:hypothetical protein [Robiginitalea biformata]|nr:hypothetical protein [Robiginitalea sp. PM2]
MAKKGKGGFRVPDNYFEELPGRVEKRLEASKGTPLPQEAGFRVPEGYFENLGERLESRLGNTPGKVRPLWPVQLGWVAAAAAAIALLFTLWPAKPVDSLQFEDLAGIDIQQYLEADRDEMDAYELAEGLPLDDIAVGDVLENIPDEEHILEYLSRDNESVDELYWDDNE